MIWLVYIAVSLLSGIGVVEYQKARTDPPPFASEAPLHFDGKIQITPTDKMDI